MKEDSSLAKLIGFEEPPIRLDARSYNPYVRNNYVKEVDKNLAHANHCLGSREITKIHKTRST